MDTESENGVDEKAYGEYSSQVAGHGRAARAASSERMARVPPSAHEVVERARLAAGTKPTKPPARPVGAPERRRTQLQTKAAETQEEETPQAQEEWEERPEEEYEEEPQEEEEALEPFGAQVARRIHLDFSMLLEDYDEFMSVLEHEGMKDHLQGILEGLEETLTATEEVFSEAYSELAGLEGVGTEEDGEMESMEGDTIEAESDGRNGEVPADEAVEGMRRAGRKDMEADEKAATMLHKPVRGAGEMGEGLSLSPANPKESGPRRAGTRVLIGKPEHTPPAAKKPQRIFKEPRTTKDLETDEKAATMLRKPVVERKPAAEEEHMMTPVGISTLRHRRGREHTPRRAQAAQRIHEEPRTTKDLETDEKAHVCPKCGESPCTCPGQAGVKPFPLVPLAIGAAAGSLMSKALSQEEKGTVGKAAGWLAQVSRTRPEEWSEGHRRESYLHHKMLHGISTLEEAHEELKPDTDGKALPSEKISPEKAREILRHGEARGHELSPKQQRMFGAAVGRGKKAAPGTEEWEEEEMEEPEHQEVHPHRRIAGEASGFLRELSDERAFGMAHQDKAAHYYKLLDPIATAVEEAGITEGDESEVVEAKDMDHAEKARVTDLDLRRLGPTSEYFEESRGRERARERAKERAGATAASRATETAITAARQSQSKRKQPQPKFLDSQSIKDEFEIQNKAMNELGRKLSDLTNKL